MMRSLVVWAVWTLGAMMLSFWVKRTMAMMDAAQAPTRVPPATTTLRRDPLTGEYRPE